MVDGITLKVASQGSVPDPGDEPTAAEPGGPEHIRSADDTSGRWDLIADAEL